MLKCTIYILTLYSTRIWIG